MIGLSAILSRSLFTIFYRIVFLIIVFNLLSYFFHAPYKEIFFTPNYQLTLNTSVILEYIDNLTIMAIPVLLLSLLPFIVVIDFCFDIFMVIKKYPVILSFFNNNNIYLEEKSYEELKKVIHGDLLKNIKEVNNTYRIVEEFKAIGGNNENYFVDKYNKEKEVLNNEISDGYKITKAIKDNIRE